MIIPTYQVVCDVCKTPKQKVNHWWVIDIIIEEGDGFISKSFHVLPYREGFPEAPGNFHLCGQACTIKKLSEFMGAK